MEHNSKKASQTWLRLASLGMAAVFFYVNVAYGAMEPARDFWQQRKAAIQRFASEASGKTAGFTPVPVPVSRDENTLLAQLPTISPNALSNSVPSLNNLKEVFQDSALSSKDESRAAGRVSWIRSVPASRAGLKELYLPPSWKPGDLMVVHVQDAHGNFDAQNNIAKILESLAGPRGGAPLLVGIEGARGAFNLAPYRSFPDTKITQEIAEYFLKESFITGPEYAGMTVGLAPSQEADDKEGLELWGVEDDRPYLEHVKAFKDSVFLKKEAGGILGALKARLKAVKEKKLNAKLKDLEEKIAVYRSGQGKLGEHVKYLAKLEGEALTGRPALAQFMKALALEESLDYKKVEKERGELTAELAKNIPKKELGNLVSASLSYRLGNLTHGAFYQYLKDLCWAYKISLKGLSGYPEMDKYIRYVLMSEDIRAEDLFADVDGLEKMALKALIQTKEEEAVLALSVDAELLEKLVGYKLSPREWEAYAARGSEMRGIEGRIKALEGELSAAGGRDPVGNGRDRSLLNSFEQFNRAAMVRNEALVRNLLAKEAKRRKDSPEAPSERIAVLITGGFHTEGMTEELKKRKTAYAVLTPRLGKVEGSGTEYLDVFTRDKTPLEKLFTGEKITLNPTPALGSIGGVRPAITALVERQYVSFGAVELILKRLRQEGVFEKDLRKSVTRALMEWMEANRFSTLDSVEVEEASDSLIKLTLRGRIDGKEKPSRVTLRVEPKDYTSVKSVSGETPLNEAVVGNDKIVFIASEAGWFVERWEDFQQKSSSLLAYFKKVLAAVALAAMPLPGLPNSSSAQLPQNNTVALEQMVAPDAGAMKRIGRSDATDEDALVSLEVRHSEFEEAAQKVHSREIKADLPTGVMAYHFKSSDGTLIVVLNRFIPSLVVPEAVFHEMREAHWISQGYSQHNAHVLASAEQVLGFAKDGQLTPYHQSQLENMSIERLESLKNETEQDRKEHHELMRQAGLDVSQLQEYEKRLRKRAVKQVKELAEFKKRADPVFQFRDGESMKPLPLSNAFGGEIPYGTPEYYDRLTQVTFEFEVLERLPDGSKLLLARGTWISKGNQFIVSVNPKGEVIGVSVPTRKPKDDKGKDYHFRRIDDKDLAAHFVVLLANVPANDIKDFQPPNGMSFMRNLITPEDVEAFKRMALRNPILSHLIFYLAEHDPTRLARLTNIFRIGDSEAGGYYERDSHVIVHMAGHGSPEEIYAHEITHFVHLALLDHDLKVRGLPSKHFDQSRHRRLFSFLERSKLYRSNILTKFMMLRLEKNSNAVTSTHIAEALARFMGALAKGQVIDYASGYHLTYGDTRLLSKLGLLPENMARYLDEPIPNDVHLPLNFLSLLKKGATPDPRISSVEQIEQYLEARGGDLRATISYLHILQQHGFISKEAIDQFIANHLPDKDKQWGSNIEGLLSLIMVLTLSPANQGALKEYVGILTGFLKDPSKFDQLRKAFGVPVFPDELMAKAFEQPVLGLDPKQAEIFKDFLKFLIFLPMNVPRFLNGLIEMPYAQSSVAASRSYAIYNILRILNSDDESQEHLKQAIELDEPRDRNFFKSNGNDFRNAVEGPDNNWTFFEGWPPSAQKQIPDSQVKLTDISEFVAAKVIKPLLSKFKPSQANLPWWVRYPFLGGIARRISIIKRRETPANTYEAGEKLFRGLFGFVNGLRQILGLKKADPSGEKIDRLTEKYFAPVYEAPSLLKIALLKGLNRLGIVSQETYKNAHDKFLSMHKKSRSSDEEQTKEQIKARTGGISQIVKWAWIGFGVSFGLMGLAGLIFIVPFVGVHAGAGMTLISAFLTGGIGAVIANAVRHSVHNIRSPQAPLTAEQFGLISGRMELLSKEITSLGTQLAKADSEYKKLLENKFGFLTIFYMGRLKQKREAANKVVWDIQKEHERLMLQLTQDIKTLSLDAKTKEVLDYLIKVAGNAELDANISAEVISNLARFVETGAPSVVSFFLEKLEPDMDKSGRERLSWILLGSPTDDEILEVLRQKTLKINERTAYMILLRYHNYINRKGLLESVIYDEKIDIKFRIYAFSWHSAQYIDLTIVGSKKRNIPKNYEEQFKKMVKALKDGAKEFAKETALDNERIEHLFKNGLLQDEEAKVYVMAVFLAAQEILPNTAQVFAKIARAISKTRALGYFHNATADFKLGGRLLKLTSQKAAFFLQVIGHELGHVILADEFGYRYSNEDSKSKIIHEIMARIQALALSETLDIDHRIVDSVLDFEKLGDNEFHEAAGDRLKEMLNELLPKGMELDAPKLLRTVHEILKNKENQGKTLDEIVSLILQEYAGGETIPAAMRNATAFSQKVQGALLGEVQKQLSPESRLDEKTRSGLREILPLLEKDLLEMDFKNFRKWEENFQVSDEFARLLAAMKLLAMRRAFGLEAAARRSEPGKNFSAPGPERVIEMVSKARYLSEDEMSALVAAFENLYETDRAKLEASLGAFAHKLFQAGGQAAQTSKPSKETHPVDEQTFMAYEQFLLFLNPKLKLSEGQKKELKKAADEAWQEGVKRAKGFSKQEVKKVDNLDGIKNDSVQTGTIIANAFDFSEITPDKITILARQVLSSLKRDKGSDVIIPLITNKDFLKIREIESLLVKEIQRLQELQAQGETRFSDPEIIAGLEKLSFGKVTITRKDLLKVQKIDPSIEMDTDAVYGKIQKEINQLKDYPLNSPISVQIFTDNNHRFNEAWKAAQLQILLITSAVQVIVVASRDLETALRLRGVLSVQQ